MNSFWIILTGALVAGACGFLGCFLVLRRLSMLGDAISHAVLPGIVIAFLLSESRASLPMFLGAVAIGLLTTFVVQSLSQAGVQGDAAIGVTFTSFFALGVVLISLYAGQVDLDLDCVLYGEISYTPLDPLILGGRPMGPRPVWITGGLMLLNLMVVALLYKEFKICAFDPQMAAAVGINVPLMHYLLMSLVSVTTVGAFESVGAILVVAMLIVPGATAYLLTDRLERMLALAVGIGALSSLSGYYVAHWLDASIAGAISMVCGGFFALALLFGPRRGVVSRQLIQQRLRLRVAEEDALLWAARRLEEVAVLPQRAKSEEQRAALRNEDALPSFTAKELSEAQECLVLEATATLHRLARAGLVARNGEKYSLTEGGRSRALALLRRHRLYESYLGDLGYPADHLHDAADRAEHHVTPAVAAAIDAATRHPERDPQGKPIPRE